MRHEDERSVPSGGLDQSFECLRLVADGLDAGDLVAPAVTQAVVRTHPSDPCDCRLYFAPRGRAVAETSFQHNRGRPPPRAAHNEVAAVHRHGAARDHLPLRSTAPGGEHDYRDGDDVSHAPIVLSRLPRSPRRADDESDAGRGMTA